jgi:predicted acyltransferase
MSPPNAGTISNSGTSSSAAAPARIISLDVFRGITVAAMILVNDPGTWSAVYWPLDHAAWNGWTPTDLIFPFFLFIVGVAMTFSFAARLRKGGTRGGLARHVLVRSLSILAVGIFLSVFPHFHFSTMRYPGVLNRIAVCYLMAGLLVVATARRADAESFVTNIPVVAGVTAVLLIGYWAAMRFIPVPGIGAANLDPANNLAAWLDRKVMYGHLWGELKQVRDPEGILSTFPAIGTVLCGVLTGEWLRKTGTKASKFYGLLGVGAIALIVGRLLHPLFPINKNLWTSTFVIFTAGFAMVILALCYWLVDMRGWRGWAQPFLVFGSNAITAFVLSTLLSIASSNIHVTDGDRQRTIHGYVFNHWCRSIAEPKNASLLFAIMFVTLCYLILLPLYLRRVFIKL